MGKRVVLLLLAGAAHGATAAPLTLEHAAARLLAESPGLKAASAAERAAIAGLSEADRRPNPTAEFEVENFAGTGPYRGFDGTEVTALVEQPIELGGKRRARVALANAEIALAVAERESEVRRLYAELIRTYANAGAARARASLAANQVEVAETLAAQGARQLAVGDIAEVDQNRLLVALGEARGLLERTTRDRDVAERSLALLIGASEPVEADPAFLERSGGNPQTITILTADDARFAALAERARAQVAAATAERRPDLAARGGVRVDREANAVALVAGISIPLPLFNPGRARVAQREAEAERASFAAEAQRREARRTAERALGNWRSALRALETIERESIRAAERLLILTERGYRLGALPYRDLADARTSLANARIARVDTLEQALIAQADLAEVTGAFAALGLPPLLGPSTSVNSSTGVNPPAAAARLP
jgi:cobalt-zinc-cadmium efflux system outer membrane protein